MKNIFLGLLLLPTVLFSQIFNPVEWSFSHQHLENDQYLLNFTATIEDGWYVYSQHIADDGPIPTEFTFFESATYELIGQTQEQKPVEQFDPNFDMVLKYFKNEATFSQKVKAVSGSSVSGELVFMVCDESQCLPPEYVEFAFSLGQTSLDHSTSSKQEEQTAPSQNDETSLQEDNSTSESSNKGMWSIFFIAFLSGFAALLTPCVFPMIPMTVSYFTKQSKNKAKGITNAII